MFRAKLEFESVGFCRERRTGEPGEKHWDSETTPSLGVPTNSQGKTTYIVCFFNLHKNS